MDGGTVYFNTHTSGRDCSGWDRCLCVTWENGGSGSTSCERCPIDTYSPGGENASCIKCPPDKPFTCSSDGKDCTTTKGSTSIASCRAGPTCSEGRGIQYNKEKSNGRCLRYIGTEADCRKAAIEMGFGHRPVVIDTRSSTNLPKGCYLSQKKVMFNAKMTNTGYCEPSAPCLCATKSCAVCPSGSFGKGGAEGICTECPSGKPYTGTDGRHTGAVAISSCSARITCNAGYFLAGTTSGRKICKKCPFDKPFTFPGKGDNNCTAGLYCPAGQEGIGFQGGDHRDDGRCQEYITDEAECKAAAKYNQPDMIGDLGIGFYIGDDIEDANDFYSDRPRGCYVDMFSRELRFNREMTNTGDCTIESVCLCARIQKIEGVCSECAPGTFFAGGTVPLEVVCAKASCNPLFELGIDYKTGECKINEGVVATATFLCIISISYVCVKCWKRQKQIILQKANKDFYTNFENISRVNLMAEQRNTSWLSDRSVPLMADVDEGLEMRPSSSSFLSMGTTASPQDLWSKLEESIYHATAATDFLATFEKMLFVLNSDEGKEALAGKKQVLLSIISLKRGEKHTHSGKAVWTKEVAQVFGKVLESLPDA